jgi:protein-tyrosine phosphatase
MNSDIHNHVIFGIDDGPKTIKGSLALLKQADKQQIRSIVSTPHVNHRKFATTMENIQKNFSIVQNEAQRTGIIADLSLSQELTLSIDLFEKYPIDKLFPLIDEQGQRYLLIEVTSLDIPYYFEDTLRFLNKQNIHCIWAHPERNIAVQDNWKLVLELQQVGNLTIQITAGSILGDYGRKAKKTAWKLLKKNMVDYVASDAHNAKSRPFQLEPALIVLQDKLKEENYLRIIENMNSLKGECVGNVAY